MCLAIFSKCLNVASLHHLSRTDAVVTLEKQSRASDINVVRFYSNWRQSGPHIVQRVIGGGYLSFSHENGNALTNSLRHT